MLDRQLRCPPTSSLGRWFDAAAALLGLCGEVRYEGQAAMQLEGLAAGHGPVAPLPEGFVIADGVLDLTPLLSTLLDCHDPAYGAALFHATLAAGLAQWVIIGNAAFAAVDREKSGKIAVAGGCAMNAVLIDALRRQLAAVGLDLLEARQAPPNDGGLALGQAWVGRRMFKEKQC